MGDDAIGREEVHLRTLVSDRGSEGPPVPLGHLEPLTDGERSQPHVTARAGRDDVARWLKKRVDIGPGCRDAGRDAELGRRRAVAKAVAGIDDEPCVVHAVALFEEVRDERPWLDVGWVLDVEVEPFIPALETDRDAWIRIRCRGWLRTRLRTTGEEEEDQEGLQSVRTIRLRGLSHVTTLGVPAGSPI